MNKISLINLLLIASFSFLQMDCKKDEQIIPPEDKPSIHPTIVWTADTIHNPRAGSQLLIYSLWGSDSNDVYAVGHNSFGGDGSMYHYDGQNWSVVKVTVGEGGFINSYVSLGKIDGSGKNDVWAVGIRGGYFGSFIDSSLVIHFDGTKWHEVIMERSKHGIQGLKVVSPTQVFLGGSYGELYHYDGIKFTKSRYDTNMSFNNLGGDNKRMLAGGHSFNGFYSVYSFNGSDDWKLIKKASEIDYERKNDFGTRDFYPLGGDKYFVCGNGIFLLSDTIWQKVYTDGPYLYNLLRGTSPSNIFAISTYNRLAHWNGVDWAQITLPEGLKQNRTINALWVDAKRIYISYNYEYSTVIIFKGEYKN